MGCPIGNLAAEMSTLDEEIRLEICNSFEQLEQFFKTMITDSIAEGITSADIDTTLVAKSLVAYLQGINLLAKSQNDPEIIKELYPTMINLIVPKK